MLKSLHQSAAVQIVTPKHPRWLISDMMVMPDYNDTDMADTLICYSCRPNDFSNIKGTPVNVHYPLRVKDNLEDGICGRPTVDLSLVFMLNIIGLDLKHAGNLKVFALPNIVPWRHKDNFSNSERTEIF